MPNLLLLNISGARYGVWEDAVSDVFGARPLHHLPLSPPVFAGMAILEDRSAVIADLGACLGRPPLASPRDGTFLIINANDKIAGFCVEGKVEGFECPRERVLSLPPAVATPVADTCALRGSSLIPIINIRNLHARLKQGLLELPSPEPGPPARAIDLSNLRRVRMVSVGGALFCVDAEDTDYTVLGESGIAPVPVQLRRLAGVILHDGAVVPVMLPEAFLGFGTTAGRKGILLAGPQSARYGIGVDQDLGVVEGPDLTVLALPKLAAKPWLPAAALAKGNICLLVDNNVFVAAEDAAMDRPEHAVFSPSSLFPTQFLKSDAAIVEFSLLGARHAVPQEEMKDDLALLPFVPVPGAPELVLGIAELRGELLPVLDLAALFGRRSLIGKLSRMMHIVNGDFQALVITDEVAGDRLLPREAQYQLPIALPHQILYGCYLEEGKVRLILNVESLAAHFEKVAVREFAAGLLPELREARAPETGSTATIAPAQLPDASNLPVDLPAGFPAGAPETDQEREPAAVPSVPETVCQPEDIARPVQDRDAGTTRDEQPVAPASAGDAAQAAVLEEESGEEDARAGAAAEAAAREQARQRIEAENQRAEDEARSRSAEQARLKAEADAKVIEEKQAQERAEKLKSEAVSREEARGKAAEEARVRAEEETRKREGEAARQQAAADARKREEEAEQQAAELARIAARETAKRAADEARRREGEEAEGRAAREALAKSRTLPGQQAEPKSSREPRPEEVRPAARKKGKYLGTAALIAFLLALVITLVNMPKRQEPRGPSMPDTAEKQTTTQRGAPQPEKEPPLYLVVPSSKAMSAQFVYTVVKGDNLWNIAKRFTGNPLSYPRIVKDNGIATPDLIFPGQKIRLMRQAAAGT